MLEKVDSNLFESDFRKYVAETAKAKKDSKEVYRNHQRSVNRSFGKGASFSNQQQNGGRVGIFMKKYLGSFKKDGGNF